MNGQKDLLAAKYISERTETLAGAFQLVGRWKAKYAPDADAVVEPPSRP